MGNQNSGRKRQEVCGNGHDLTEPENVILIRRAQGKTERACRPCANRRKREWWKENRG